MRSILLLAVFFAVGSAYAESNPPSPTPTKAAAKPQNNSAARIKNSTVGNQSAIAASPPVEISPPSFLKIEFFEKEEDRHGYSSAEWWIVYITGALAAITFGLAFYTGRLYKATVALSKDSQATSELARQDFITTHRPKLIIRRISLDEGNGNYVSPGSRSPKIQFIIANIGGSRATIIESNATFAKIDGVLPSIPPYSLETNTIKCTIREAGQSDPPEILDIGDEGEVSRDVRSWSGGVITNGDKPPFFYFFGYIQYEDGIGIVRRMTFCRKYNPTTKRFIEVGDPEYEYSD